MGEPYFDDQTGTVRDCKPYWCLEFVAGVLKLAFKNHLKSVDGRDDSIISARWKGIDDTKSAALVLESDVSDQDIGKEATEVAKATVAAGCHLVGGSDDERSDDQEQFQRSAPHWKSRVNSRSRVALKAGSQLRGRCCTSSPRGTTTDRAMGTLPVGAPDIPQEGRSELDVEESVVKSSPSAAKVMISDAVSLHAAALTRRLQLKVFGLLLHEPLPCSCQPKPRPM